MRCRGRSALHCDLGSGGLNATFCTDRNFPQTIALGGRHAATLGWKVATNDEGYEMSGGEELLAGRKRSLNENALLFFERPLQKMWSAALWVHDSEGCA